ncbi:MAG TPA: FAD-binding protein, partial [Gammaproteobacteria bacterium]|nr:FAD-binding protein [Gammaproteobacteria bacterium]
IDTKTAVDGVFAAGECACVSLNGANRLGSNSLTELLVFGARAGRGAAAHARDAAAAEAGAWRQRAEASVARVEALLERPRGEETIAGLRTELHEFMESCVGIYRDAAMLERACDGIGRLRERYRALGIEDKSRVYNTELMYALELGAMLDVAETMAHAARGRLESRGAHQRLDYVERDDEGFLVHSVAHCTGEGPPSMERKDVTITQWEPGERVYGGPEQ